MEDSKCYELPAAAGKQVEFAGSFARAGLVGGSQLTHARAHCTG